VYRIYKYAFYKNINTERLLKMKVSPLAPCAGKCTSWWHHHRLNHRQIHHDTNSVKTCKRTCFWNPHNIIIVIIKLSHFVKADFFQPLVKWYCICISMVVVAYITFIIPWRAYNKQQPVTTYICAMYGCYHMWYTQYYFQTN